MSEPPNPYWGNILKSNWNGTYYGLSMENVNRDERGFVDFEKMIGLDGIALINVVSNPSEAMVSGRKTLQSRITHNDGKSLPFQSCNCISVYLCRKYMENACTTPGGFNGSSIHMQQRGKEISLLPLLA